MLGGQNLQTMSRGIMPSPTAGARLLQVPGGGGGKGRGLMGLMGPGQVGQGSYVSAPRGQVGFGSNPFYSPALGSMRGFNPVRSKIGNAKGGDRSNDMRGQQQFRL